MTLTKRERNKIDKQIEEIVYRRLSGVPINVMDIGKVFDAGYHARTFGDDIETAVVDEYTRLSQKS